MQYFESLGRELEQRWSRAAFDAHAFGAIAAEVLERMPAHQHTGVAQLVEHVLDPPADRLLLPQHDVAASFGDPPVTVYTGRGFYVAVNLWRSSTTSIHQHAFSGAFQVLEGSSVHTGYSFREQRRINSHLRLGAIDCTAIEILEPGDTRTIPAGQGSAHSLFHLEHPSATVVVRTLSEGDFEPQLAYLPPRVAYDPFFGMRSVDPVLKRRLQILDFLEDTRDDAFLERLARLIFRSDPWTVFSALLHLLEKLVKRAGTITVVAERMMALLAPLRDADPELGEALERSLVESARRMDMEARRDDLRSSEHRFFWSVMMSSPDRESAFLLLRQRHPGADPLELCFRWIDEMAGVADPDDPEGRMSLLGMETDAVAVLKLMIRHEPSFEGLLELLGNDYSAEEIQQAKGDLEELYLELRTLSPWKAFFVHAAGSSE